MTVCLGAVIALTSCGTFKEMSCSFSDEDAAADRAEKALAVVRGNITRGYAIHYQRQSVPYQEIYCVTPTIYGCSYYAQRTLIRTVKVEVPVSIDIEHEKRKLPVLTENARRLRRIANDVYQKCINA